MSERHEKPGTPGDILEHVGVKGMRWGVRKQEETSPRETTQKEPIGKAVARLNDTQKQQKTKELTEPKPFKPGTPEFQQMIERVTRTDHPQVLGVPKDSGGKIESVAKKEKHGLTDKQKMLLAFGAVTAAGAGYYAYKHYTGGKLPKGISADVLRQQQEVKLLEGMKLPAHWDVSKLSSGPISTQKLGHLGGGHAAAELLDKENLVINTSRGYADVLPKGGFSNPFAAEQHASVTRVLEEMRDKYPSIRNMNVEVVPMSKVPGMEGSFSRGAMMSVMSMRAGEARVMYNDVIDAPSAASIRANRSFVPGLGKKDYIAYHEMGHLLAAAHGEFPPSFNLLVGGQGSILDSLRERGTWHKAEPLLHKKMFQKHGFTFKELSKLSEYAATQPAEGMAELFGHLSHPEMRSRLTPDQITRATAMFNEMGGVT